MKEVDSSLSVKRIVISVLAFILIPICAYFINIIVDELTISWTIAINCIGCFIVIYDWNLIAIHYRRSKNNMGDSILFFIVGVFFIGAWTWLNKSFLHIYIPAPDPNTSLAYLGGVPLIFLAYSFGLSFLTTITFKCLTDHMNIKSKEVQVILTSGFLMALIFVVTIIPFDIGTWLRSYLYYVVVISFMSYLYNQTTSFIPGMLSLGTVWLIINVASLLALLQ